MERTKEIGTMKAIGAQNSNVLSLLVVELLMIGILGATSGLLAGIAGGYVLIAGLGSSGRTGGDTSNGIGNISPVFLPADLATVWAISVGLSLIAGIFLHGRHQGYLLLWPLGGNNSSIHTEFLCSKEAIT